MPAADPWDPAATVLAAGDTPGKDSASVAFASFRTRNWTVDDGLLGRAYDVAQTPDGYLWVATDEGLFRFDGARFVGFTAATVPVFRSDDFISVNVLPSGDLWVGSRDRWTYRLRDGVWTAYSADEAFGRKDWVQGFVEDGEGTVWTSSTGRVVARFDGEEWVPVHQRVRDVWTPLVADAKGTLWTYLAPSDAPGLPVSPLYARPGQEGVVAQWDGERFEPPGDWRLFGFEQTQYGPLFHRPADATRGPTSIEAARGLRIQLADADGTQRGTYTVEDVPRSAHLVDRAGRVWTEPLVSDGSLTVLVGDTEVARIRPEGSKWIESVFEDRQGNVWVLSSGGGLLQATPEPFRRFGPDEGAPLDAESAFVTPDGTVLVSAAPGAESAPLFVVRDGAWTSSVALPGAAALSPGDPNRTPSVGMVMEDGRGRRFGTYSSRLVQLNGDRVGRAWASRGGHDLRVPFPDPDDPDVLWVGDGGGVLRQFDTEAFVVTDSIRVPMPSAGYPWPTDVHRTPDGRLWIASRGGLVVIGEEGRPRPVEPLAGVPIRDLVDGPDGALWAATETRGLIRIRNGRVDALGLDDGLPTLHIVAVLFDDSGFVWLSGRTLLYRIRVEDAQRAFDASSPEPVDVVTLLPSAGHLGSADVFARATKALDGSLWIPSGQGVTRIDPEAYVHQFAAPPPVIVEAVRTRSGERPVAVGGASVHLPRGDRSPTVEYTAIDLTAPDLVRFRTRLVGLEETWQDQGSARSVVYERFRPGTYTFQVQARNGGGVWSAPIEATLVVPAFFYETGWFATLCGLGLLGVLGLGLRARERTLTARQRQLEALVKERTEQLRIEKETVAAQAQSLEALDKAKSRFFANVSHEFRTPLTLTLGPLDDLQAGLYGPLDAPMASQVNLARRNAARVLDLINQILEVARLEAGQTPLSARPLDLGAFVEAIARPFEAQAARQSIRFHLDGPAVPIEVLADPVHLERALSNLLSNALKFTPGGGGVRVGVDASEAAARVSVRDSGPGIPADDLPHVFDRFYQVDESSPTQPGTGIGLALVKEVVDLHGGTLAVVSEEGFGSTFTLTLPLGRTHLAPEQVAQDAGPWEPSPPSLPLPAPSRGDGRVGEPPAGAAGLSDADSDRTTVLVVEDHADVRAYVRRHLEPDYRVIDAADGEAGLAAARERLPDLVVSDVMMPKMDGIALCRALKADADTDFIPVVLLTAKAAPEDKLHGLRELCDDYLTKPFDPAELRARIDNLIRVRQQLRERFQVEGVALAVGEPAAVPPEALGDSSPPPPSEGPLSTPSADAFFEQVRGAIEDHLDDETFTVERLAEAVGYSRGHLHRQSKAMLDQTPSDLIRTLRLDRAAELLASQAGTVSEVAYAVGFKSLAHFSNRFTEEFGCRPSAYAREPSTTSDE